MICSILQVLSLQHQSFFRLLEESAGILCSKYIFMFDLSNICLLNNSKYCKYLAYILLRKIYFYKKLSPFSV